jgi:hypothetical protein
LFYHVSPGTIDSLRVGEARNFNIAFSIINMSGEKDFNYIVSAKEVTKQQAGRIVILNILDYLREEINRIAARIADVESRIKNDNLKAGLSACNDTLTEIKTQMSNGQFISAKDNIVFADNCIDNIENQISGNGLPFNIGNFSWIIIGLVLAIMIIVLLIIIFKRAKKTRVLNPIVPRTKPTMTAPRPNMERIEKTINDKSFQDRLKEIHDKLGG